MTMDTQQVDDIEKRVQEAITEGAEAAAAAHGGNPEFTVAIKESLTRLGKKLGYRVCTTLPNIADYPEWLWDLTWVRGGDKAGVFELSDMPLAVESEWKEDFGKEILSDFQKLMVARAWLRVMVFQTPNAEVKMRFDQLREAIRTYSGTQPGDRYLFACWNYDPAVWAMQFEGHVA
jgi:hypothetical protein